ERTHLRRLHRIAWTETPGQEEMATPRVGCSHPAQGSVGSRLCRDRRRQREVAQGTPRGGAPGNQRKRIPRRVSVMAGETCIGLATYREEIRSGRNKIRCRSV